MGAPKTSSGWVVLYRLGAEPLRLCLALVALGVAAVGVLILMTGLGVCLFAAGIGQAVKDLRHDA